MRGASCRPKPPVDDLEISSNTFWLDRLPLDACERIAANICCGQPNSAALALAQTSAQQQQAVAKAVNFTFNSGHFAKVHDALAWVEILSPYVRHVQLEDGSPTRLSSRKAGKRTKLFQLFLSPSLQSWTVETSEPWLLNKLAERSWNHVDSHLRFYSHIDTKHDVLQIIKAISPKRLTLHDLNLGEFDVNSFAEWEENFDFERYRDSFAKVQSIEIGFFPVDPVLSRMLQVFQGKAKIVVEFPLPEEELEALRAFPNVEVCLAMFADFEFEELPISTAIRIGHSLTEVFDAFPFFPEYDINDLAAACPNVRRLNLELNFGEEEFLANTLHRFPELVSLGLDFRFPDDPDLHTTSPGAVLHVVQNCSKMEELRMSWAHVPQEELAEVFQVLGTRLKVFSLCVDDRGEESFDLLYHAVKAASLYCPQLCSLTVYAPHVSAELNRRAVQWQWLRSFFSRKRRKSEYALLGRVLSRRIQDVSAIPALMLDEDYDFNAPGYFRVDLSRGEHVHDYW